MLEDILKEEEPKKQKKIKKPTHRFSVVSVTKVPKIGDLLAKNVYVITHGRGSAKDPLAISIPFSVYQQVPRIAEFLALLANYSNAISDLRRMKYNNAEGKLTLEKLVQESKVNVLALEQVIRDEVVKAMENL